MSVYWILVRMAVTIICTLVGFNSYAIAREAEKEKDQAIMIDIYPTFGPFGAIRKAEYLPGDQLFLCYRIAGLTTDESKQVNASVQCRIYHDKQGLFGEFQMNAINYPLSFGGDGFSFDWTKLSHVSTDSLAIPKHAPPGNYRLEIIVHDQLTDKKQAKLFLFKVLPKGTLGAINVRLSRDPGGEHPFGSHPSVGQTAFITCGLIGQSVVDNKMRVRLSLRIKTKDGNLVNTKGEEFTVDKEVIPAALAEHGCVPINYGIFLNRPGRFLLELEIEDLLSKNERKVSYTIPIVVVAPWEEPNLGKAEISEPNKNEKGDIHYIQRRQEE